MKHPLHFRMITVFIVVMLGIFLYPANAQAKSSALVTTTLTMQTAETVQIGSSSPVIIKLTSTKGEPIPDQPIEFYVNGALERRSRTNAEGSVTLKFQQEAVGIYSLVAIYKGSGSPTILASKATAKVTVIPAKIEIRVTPPLADIRFSLNNQIFSSNSDGRASIEMEKTGKFRLELLTPKTEDENMKIEFSRWGDDTFVPYRDIEVPLEQPLDVGFEVSYQVSQTFVDLDGQAVDPSRISSVTIKGSNGTTYTFNDHLPHWLLAGRVIRLSNGLEQTKILYSVIDVTIDGSNVVSQAQQRFFAEPNDVWSLKLLLYSAKFTARDALFRFPIGTGIKMEYPDGEIKTFQFDSSNEHTSEGLARGIYHVTVTGVRGIAPPTPIALSRNQDVELIVLSYIDIGVMLALGLFFAFGLLLFGRPKILAYLVAIPKRLIALPKQWATQSANSPRPSKRLNSTGITGASQETTPLPQVNYELSVEEPHQISQNEQIDIISPPQQLEEEALPVLTSNEMQVEETVLPSATAVVAMDVEQSESIEAPPIPNLSLEEEPKDVAQPVLNDMPVHAITEQHHMESMISPSPMIVPEIQTVGPVIEVSNPAQMKIAFACRVCGSSHILKVGINRRGTQQYICETCGTFNIFETKRTGKSRRKKKVANLS